MGALAALTLGVHLASVHIPARAHHHNTNPGLYLRVDSGPLPGITAGAYRNSLGRASLYAGHTSTWRLGGQAVELTLGAVSGYRRQCTSYTVHRFAADGSTIVRSTESTCQGATGAALAPFIAPSVALPVQLLGITPRVTLHGAARGSSTAIHLSAERAF